MYNAFISYSHAADDQFAPSLQKALQNFAKPWYRKRNLEIFRDESSLSASPHLWDNITRALDASEYLILLASPESEKSKWVNKEVEYWLEQKSIDNIMIALTEGNLEWDDSKNGFRHPDANSLPPALDGRFTEEPFYIDLRLSRTEKDLSPDNPIFKKEVLKLAAKLHGKQPNDLASEEVSVHRKMIWVRNAAVAALSVLFLSALGATWFANQELHKATANYLRSEAKNIQPSDPTIALRLYEQVMHFYDDSVIENEANRVYRDNDFYRVLFRDSTDTVSAIAYSPDGEKILVCSLNGMTRLVNLQGELLEKFKLSTGIISAAFSSDGSSILISSADSIARVLDLNGHLRHVLKKDNLPVSAIAFTPDGETIFTGAGTMARFWSKEGKLIREFDTHLVIDRVSMARDRDLMVISDGDRVNLWSLSGVLKEGFNDLKDVALGLKSGIRVAGSSHRMWAKIYSLVISPGGETVVIGFGEGSPLLYDVRSRTFAELNGDGPNVDVSPDGQQILGALYGGTIRVWGLDGQIIRDLKHGVSGEFAAIESDIATFSPASSLAHLGRKSILSLSGDGMVRLWDLKESAVHELNSGHFGLNVAAAISPDGTKLATVSAPDSLAIWDFESSRLDFYMGSTQVESLSFTPDSRGVLVSGYHARAMLFDLKGSVMKAFDTNSGMGFSSIAQQTGDMVLGSQKTGYSMYSRDGKLTKRSTTKGDLSYLSLSPTGKTIMVCLEDSSHRLYDPEGRILAQMRSKGTVRCGAISPDGNTFIAGGVYGQDLTLRNLHGDSLRSFGMDQAEVLVFAPDGRSLAIGEGTNDVDIWDLQGHHFWTYDGPSNGAHQDNTVSISFSPGRKLMVAGSGDGTVRFFPYPMLLKDYFLSGHMEDLSSAQRVAYKIK